MRRSGVKAPDRLVFGRNTPKIRQGTLPGHGQGSGVDRRGADVENSTKDTAHLRSLLEEDEATMSVVITDPSLPDNPMIYVSDEFETQTGYSVEEATGQNCRFLQGPDTDPHAV